MKEAPAVGIRNVHNIRLARKSITGSIPTSSVPASILDESFNSFFVEKDIPGKLSNGSLLTIARYPLQLGAEFRSGVFGSTDKEKAEAYFNHATTVDERRTLLKRLRTLAVQPEFQKGVVYDYNNTSKVEFIINDDEFNMRLLLPDGMQRDVYLRWKAGSEPFELEAGNYLDGINTLTAVLFMLMQYSPEEA